VEKVAAWLQKNAMNRRPRIERFAIEGYPLPLS
jgi:hypothetical protein